MAAPFGPPAGDEALGVLTDMAFAGDELGGMEDTVICQVCQSEVDSFTGEPVGPVDSNNAMAAQTYVAGGGGAAAAQFGGEALLPLPEEGMGGF